MSYVITLSWVLSLAHFAGAEEKAPDNGRSLIINGDFAPSGAYPWFARGTGCGGALISPEFVITGKIHVSFVCT